MIDPRWRELAQILVGYCNEVCQGDRVLITMTEAYTLPLVRAVHDEVVRAGGLPQVEFVSAELEYDLMAHGSREQVAWIPELQRAGMDWADVYFGIRGADNPHLLDEVPADRIAARRRALGVVSAMRTRSTRWVLVRVPGPALAQQAGLPLDTLEEIFFSSVLRDWPSEIQRYDEIRALFHGGKTVEIIGRGTRLTMDTSGRRFILDDGRVNMPGGEVMTSPDEMSVAGEIAFENPGVIAGQFVPGIRLRFEDGVVAEAHADSNEALLHQLLDTDVGARRVGEFGVGLNDGLTRFCGDILYDEKIRGTVHIALGRAYEECGGTNDSALHWDLVKDTRTDGSVLVDGQPVLKNGRFATEWKQ